MQNLARSFASRWHSPLVAAQMPIKWPQQYIDHAIQHPTIVRLPRRRRKAPVSAPIVPVGESESGEDSSEERNNSEGEDDMDVSPYR